ncbi:MAG TPA: HdeD family acid-resistance protein [Rhizomicrobium sp.]|nr:HdeD family acid-resistance protein [Rhizomicrobium sp.]
MNGTFDGLFHTRLRASTSHLFWVGLALAVLGIAALVFPVISTLAAALFAGWVFLFSGVVLLIGSFSIHGTGPFFGALLISLLSIAAGAFLVFHPFAGELGLTVFLVVLFLVEGVFEIVFAFEMRPHPGWSWMLISGLASIILALLIAAGLPGTSLIALGVLLGVNFLSTGLGYILVSRAVRRAA